MLYFLEYAKVIYKYEAANSDELSLPEDAVILVLNKNCEDEGWFEGEYNGKRGLFPENFVNLIESSSPSVPDKFHNLTPPTLPAKPNKPIASVSATAPVATIRDIPLGNTLSNSGSDFLTINSKSTVSNIEERKSMIAGLQSKLFPMGKLPQKPSPPSNHASIIASGDKEKPDEEDINKLSSLTKSRPKQNNKRPPSLNFHNNKMVNFFNLNKCYKFLLV